MIDKRTLVYVDLEGAPLLVGRLWAHARKGKQSTSFEYDPSWLERRERFSLEPALKVGPGPFHTPGDMPMFGAIGDSAPDRWGRALMRRVERRRAEREGTPPRTLQEIDYLLLVDDEARQGALRFADHEGGPILRDEREQRIPPLVQLPRLLAAAENFVEEKENDEDLRLLFAPGSSLGGARPKASVRAKDGQLAIAKFPRRDDEFNAVAWESISVALAARSGIDVPAARIEVVAGKQVLLLRRFDRSGAQRLPFLSAMSMLGAKDNETRSYLEIVDALRQYGAAPRQDMESLWRRILFSILISNTDDHLRNHGFLYEGSAGWRLSPAYDLNPVPVDIKPRFLTTAITEADNRASLDLAYEVAAYFKISDERARSISGEVGRAVGQWRDEATRHGLKKSEIDRMASAFEHRDLAEARTA